MPGIKKASDNKKASPKNDPNKPTNMRYLLLAAVAKNGCT
jgi:hypothetical protein